MTPEIFENNFSLSSELKTEFQRKEAATTQKMNFIRMASFEFRSSLSTILSSINLLDRYQVNGDLLSAKRHVEKMKHAIGGMRDMLDYFMGVSCADYVRLKKETLQFNDFYNACTAELNQPEVNSKSGQTVQYVSKGTKPVSVNIFYIACVAKNLLAYIFNISDETAAIKVSFLDFNDNIQLNLKVSHTVLHLEHLTFLTSPAFNRSGSKHPEGDRFRAYMITKYLDELQAEIKLKNISKKGYEILLTIPND